MFGIDHIAGLPVHALVVHFAVVLVPLAAIALVATGWKAEWRKRYALVIALIAIAGAIAAYVAAQTGEDLEHTVRQSAATAGAHASFGEHPEEGSNAEVASILFAVAAAAFFGLEQFGDKMTLLGEQVLRWRPVASYAAASTFAVIALTMMVIAGHSGAVLVWKDVGNYVSAK